jgi:hypothetical protein
MCTATTMAVHMWAAVWGARGAERICAGRLMALAAVWCVSQSHLSGSATLLVQEVLDTNASVHRCAGLKPTSLTAPSGVMRNYGHVHVADKPPTAILGLMMQFQPVQRQRDLPSPALPGCSQGARSLALFPPPCPGTVLVDVEWRFRVETPGHDASTVGPADCPRRSSTAIPLVWDPPGLEALECGVLTVVPFFN